MYKTPYFRYLESELEKEPQIIKDITMAMRHVACHCTCLCDEARRDAKASILMAKNILRICQ